MKNNISHDSFVITLPGFPDLVIEPADVEELENVSFYRVNGLQTGDLVTCIVVGNSPDGTPLHVEFTDGDRVISDDTSRDECHFTHTVKQDEERVSLEIWSGEKSDANNIHRTVVLIFNVK